MLITDTKMVRCRKASYFYEEHNQTTPSSGHNDSRT